MSTMQEVLQEQMKASVAETFALTLMYFILQKAKQLIAKKEEGNKVFRAGNFEEAYKIYTEALEIDPNNKFTNSKLYCNRATVCTKVLTLSHLNTYFNSFVVH